MLLARIALILSYILLVATDEAPKSSAQLIQDLLAVPGVTLRYYLLTSNNADALRSEIERLGPVDEVGRHRDAYTHWRMAWKWPTKNGHPDLANSKVSLNVEVTIPALQTELDGPLKVRWERYLEQLLRHESRHVELALQHKALLQQLLRQYDTEAIPVSYQTANALAKQVLAELRAADRAYDQSTAHGRLEGVRFP